MNRLDGASLRRWAAAFLAEDVGRGDVTTAAVVPAGLSGRARIEARAPFVVCGLDLARACFEELGAISWESSLVDGERVEAGDVLARLGGELAAILTAERTALNLLGRLSGIATTSAAFAAAVAGTATRVVDTRKTTPGLRVLEKYAVAVGGCHNHRSGLDDGVLIKDNHIAAAGGIGEAVRRARAAVPHGLLIEVEVSDLDGLDEAVAAGADAVLLDNMDPAGVALAVARAGGKVVLEASGRITLDNVRAYAETGVDLVSCGALTHSAGYADLALEVERWAS